MFSVIFCPNLNQSESNGYSTLQPMYSVRHKMKYISNAHSLHSIQTHTITAHKFLPGTQALQTHMTKLCHSHRQSAIIACFQVRMARFHKIFATQNTHSSLHKYYSDDIHIFFSCDDSEKIALYTVMITHEFHYCHSQSPRHSYTSIFWSNFIQSISEK